MVIHFIIDHVKPLQSIAPENTRKVTWHQSDLVGSCDLLKARELFAWENDFVSMNTQTSQKQRKSCHTICTTK